MKEINGTITLAYVEEDNRQRVIFRVIPLCTREGNVFHGGADDFPDEGSLRIVPDKREQRTFKERMREAGGLCAIQLASEGKELFFPADTVLLSAGMKARAQERDSFEGIAFDVIPVGDCEKPGLVKDAIHTGFNAALSLHTF